jgi:hypothetical protein
VAIFSHWEGAREGGGAGEDAEVGAGRGRLNWWKRGQGRFKFGAGIVVTGFGHIWDGSKFEADSQELRGTKLG